ncbi:LptF/LptG family permease, partial [Candidatus Dependentiae bacterium]|nr:LptF/LptG family permease [Candidatus Dependentiae bacterium]
MVLKKYIIKRFFKYLFIINISLTLLFNFIEFFEKIVRVKHATISMILKFIALNIPSSFFETLSISCWLATCLLIKEFAEQNEWDTFKILNINYNKLFKLFLFAGIITAIFAFIGREQLTLKLQNKSEKFKFEKLKQNSYQKIYNKWLEIKSKNKKYFKTFSFF